MSSAEKNGHIEVGAAEAAGIPILYMYVIIIY
jgi:hypothetical protein